MKILLVKTSSLGDLIHTFPAITDAVNNIPDIRFDWVVEEAFAEVPTWHPAVGRVIPVSLRRWRKNGFQSIISGELKAFHSKLRQDTYDLVIDAQGLFLKSGLISSLARGRSAGYDWASARDGWSSLCYRRKISVPRNLHAIERIRQLFSRALDYQLSGQNSDYGLQFTGPEIELEQPYLVFLHGTAWPSKHWPESYWTELTRLAREAGYHVNFPWGDTDDRLRAERIIELTSGRLLPGLQLGELAAILKQAAGAVGGCRSINPGCRCRAPGADGADGFDICADGCRS